MLHKLKPVPRAIVILGIVGGIGFALTTVDFAKLLPKKAAPVTTQTVDAPAVTTVTPPTTSATPLETANSAVQAATQAAAQAALTPAPAAPVGPAPGLTPAGGHDAGLANVLKK